MRWKYATRPLLNPAQPGQEKAGDRTGEKTQRACGVLRLRSAVAHAASLTPGSREQLQALRLQKPEQLPLAAWPDPPKPDRKTARNSWDLNRSLRRARPGNGSRMSSAFGRMASRCHHRLQIVAQRRWSAGLQWMQPISSSEDLTPLFERLLPVEVVIGTNLATFAVSPGRRHTHLRVLDQQHARG